MRKIIAITLILISGTTQAAIYVNENSSGGIEYTDTPGQSSKPVAVPSTNSISTPKPAPQPTPATEPSASPQNDDQPATTTSQANTYQTLEIISPKNDESIQNQPVIPVEMRIEPNMLPGDKIQLMLDGKPVGTPTATAYQELGLVERGTHTLEAVIINNKDQIIKRSSTITINVHRNSVINSPAMQR